MSFPHATETVQWEDKLVFKIAGKMFAIVRLNPPHDFAFKCAPEKFAELTELEGTVPAPQMARAQWVSLQRHDALEAGELRELTRNSYGHRKVQAAQEGAREVKKIERELKEIEHVRSLHRRPCTS